MRGGSAREDAGGGEHRQEDRELEIKEEGEQESQVDEPEGSDGVYRTEPSPPSSLSLSVGSSKETPEAQPVTDTSLSTNETHSSSPNDIGPVTDPRQSSTVDLASVEWSYLDPQGQVQGKFLAE